MAKLEGARNARAQEGQGESGAWWRWSLATAAGLEGGQRMMVKMTEFQHQCVAVHGSACATKVLEAMTKVDPEMGKEHERDEES